MNISLGILFIILGTLMAFFEVKRLLAIKRNYFGGIVLIVLYLYTFVGGVFMIIHNRDKFLLSWLMETIITIIILIRVIRFFTRRLMAIVRQKK